MEFWDLAKEFGGWAAFVLYILYTQRERIFALFDRHARLHERDREQDLAFEDQTRQRLLNGDTQLRRILQSEQVERRALTRTAIEQARTAEHLASQAVEVMKDFADIARLQTDRLDKLTTEIMPVLREVKGVMDALWFILVRNVQRSNDEYAEQLIEKATKGERGESV